MQIIENIISNGHGNLNPSFVCIHETANPGATALNHVNYWSGDDTYAVHYVADWHGIAYHCVPNNRLCYQVGNGNSYVIGIELCHAITEKQFQAVWKTGVEWAAYMLKVYGWGVDRLLSHDDCRRIWGGTDHTDPIGYFEEWGRSWNQFKNEVDALLKRGGSNPMYSAYNKGGDVYRVDNPNGFHFYTLSKEERDNLVRSGWKDEGVAFTAPRGGEDPIYRMYNPNNGDHYYTANFGECTRLEKLGWVCEGIPFFANPTGDPVYQLYNPYSGEHFLTADEKERDNLRRLGWIWQGGFTV